MAFLAGLGSIVGGIFGKKSADKSADRMAMLAQQMQMDPAAKQWAQGILQNPQQRENDYVQNLQGIGGRAIDQQQENAMKAFNAQHAARFSMGAGSGGAGPSATKFLNMTRALADARANAMSGAQIQGRQQAFGEQARAAQMLGGNQQAYASMMGDSEDMRNQGMSNMVGGIGAGLEQMFMKPQQQQRGQDIDPWVLQAQRSALMGGQQAQPQYDINAATDRQWMNSGGNRRLNTNTYGRK